MTAWHFLTAYSLVSLLQQHSLVQAQGSAAHVSDRSLRGWGPWTAWSVCSHPCGYGTAYRIRQCHARTRPSHGSSVCQGPSKQHQICRVKNCTDNHSDYRWKECARHNDIYYGSRTYSWVPYLNSAAPCELSCKSVGYGYYARFKKSVPDGVICNEEKTAACMEGECVESGCDGVLGSGAKPDRCGVCAGDGTSCRVISGIFTRTHLTHRGYNVVTSIPAGACSINITEMRRSKNYLALSTPTGYFLNGDLRLMPVGSVKGAGTTFTYSRTSGPTCPGECLTAPGPINTTLRVELIYFGRNPGILYQFTVPRENRLDVTQPVNTDDSLSISAEVIPRIRHGKSPVYIPDTPSHSRYHRQQLQQQQQPSSDLSRRNGQRRVASSKLSANIRPSGLVDTDTFSSSPNDALKASDHRSRSRVTVSVNKRPKTARSRDKSRDHSSTKKSRGKHVSHRRHRFRPSKVAPGPSKGQFFLKNPNGSIQYKHYYHTNSQDGLGDVPVAASRDGSSTAGIRSSRRDSERDRYRPDESVNDDNYAEFRSTTQYQPRFHTSSHSNVISTSADVNQNVRPSPPQVYSSVDRTSGRGGYASPYSGHDNRVASQTGGELLYTWRISGFTDCTEPCGGGLQQTRVVCVKGDTQVEVIEDNCPPNLRPEPTTVICNNQPCQARWAVSEWGQCSVTCGRGLQKRKVECKQRISPTLTISVSASVCGQPRPQSRQYCQLEPCFAWKTSEWGKCSTGCGFGQRNREITCVDTDGKNVSERMCTQIRPSLTEICDMGSCAQGWFHSKWSKQCSAECGRGLITRQVYCSSADGSPLSETKCEGKKRKPKDRKPCRAIKPCGGQWFTGPWSKCNATCGADAVKRRDVLCIKQHGKRVRGVVKDHNCEPELKPPHLKFCSSLPPCKPQWYMMAWSECSKSCGTGVRTREIKCLDTNMTPSPDCNKDQKPSRRQSCNKHSCDARYAEFSQKPESTTNEVLQKDGLPQGSLPAQPCKDKKSSQWCLFARQARLCLYDHYKTLCCHSCRKLDPKPH